jgi:hypothetical protein
MERSHRALDAVYALFYLPEHFKLIFTGSLKAGRSFFDKLMSHADGLGVGERVSFALVPIEPDVVILPSAGNSRSRTSITGDSPEALASAILDVARSL